ncbi:MAG: hypothetical protein ACYSWP_19270 [Planctomycetota bacterium]|jgi:hypothetical protein
MKRIVLCAVLTLVFAACSHSDGVGMGTTVTNLDSNVIPTFKELSIDYGQAVSPQWVNELVVIKNTPQIDRVITQGSWSDDETVAAQVVCKAFVPLKQEEYDDILQLVVDAGLEDYTPPEDCQELVGGTGITIGFQKSDGVDHGFHTLCELEPKIDALVKRVSEYADVLISDCDLTMAEFTSGEETSEEEALESTTEEAAQE